MRCSTIARPQPGRQSVLPEALTKHNNNNDEHRFNTVTLQPITPFTYELGDDQCEEDKRRAPNYTWATLLSQIGANVEPPPSAEMLPFQQTPPSPELDVAIREMLTHNILVVDANIRAAFQLVAVPRPDGTYDAVQDFHVWEKNYPRRNYIRLAMSPQTIQRVSPFDKMIKIKLTDIFAQLSISEDMQKFSGVHYRGRCFAMTRLPPRHPRSAHIAQRWVEVVAGILEHKFGVYAVVYQDELLLHAVQVDAREIVGFLEETLGVHVDRRRSVLEPTTDLEFFGLRVSSAKQSVRISDDTRDVLIACMKHIDRYDSWERDKVACLWWWVAYHLRLPRLIEDDILLGKPDFLTIAMVELEVYAPRHIKRARRKIFIYSDVLKGRTIAYAPEFNVQIDKNITEITSITDSTTTEVLSAIESAKWAVKKFVPDGVDLAVYVNSAEAHTVLTRGSYDDFKPIMKNFVKLYKKVKSRNVIWQSTKSSVSVKELLKHIDSLDEPTPICDLIKRTISTPPEDEPKRKIKGRSTRILKHALKNETCGSFQPSHSNAYQSISEIPLPCEESSGSKEISPPQLNPSQKSQITPSFIGMIRPLSLNMPYFSSEECRVKFSTALQHSKLSSEGHKSILGIGMRRLVAWPPKWSCKTVGTLSSADKTLHVPQSKVPVLVGQIEENSTPPSW